MATVLARNWWSRMLTRLVEGADAGIREGDVIEQINQKRVKSVADVRNELQRSGSNPLLLLINRRGTTIFLM